MIYFLILFIFINVIIGLFVTLLSRSKYPYTVIPKSSHIKFNIVNKINDEKDSQLEKEIINMNNQEKVNELVEKIIPKIHPNENPSQKMSHEIEEKVKGYFDSNPNEATKIFKTMLKNK